MSAGRSVKVTVVPRSSKPRVETVEEGCYRVHVAAPPDRGRANAEVLKALAQHLDVPRSSLEIVRGHTSREKLVNIAE